MKSGRPIFLDNHSTTPIDPRVLDDMLPYFGENFGNPGSRTHAFGLAASRAVEEARKQVARLLGAEDRDILFTSGATESNNLAIKGVASFHRDRGNHIITSDVEHPSVLDPCKALTKRGFQLTQVGVNRHGEVIPEEVERAITSDTLLVSIMLANHEIGTLNDIAAIGRITRSMGVFLHCDATQAVGTTPIDVEALRVDLLSLSAHKIYGPKGAGALYVRRRNPRVRLTPLLDGGGQERGFRSGTLNVPGIVGLGAACRLCREEMNEERVRLARLRELLRSRLCDKLTDARVNGHPENRLPGNLNLSVPGVDGNALLKRIGRRIAISLGSACTSAIPRPSHVLKAIRVPQELLYSTFRFGLGRFTTEEEVEQAAEEFLEAVRFLRDAEARKTRSRASGRSFVEP
jgi:cysteine desulfurase